MADIQSPAAISKHSSLYKVGSPPTWKDSYKKRCAERLKGSRAKLLQRYRELGSAEEKSENDKMNSSIVDDVMREEWESIQREDSSASNFNQIFEMMEQIKLELLLQEREILLQHDRMKEYDETDLRNSIAGHEHLGQKEVICPLCHSNYLEKHFNVIRCHCGMCIDTEQDCISLDHVQVQLRVGTTAHAEMCSARPVFGIVQGLGPKNLLMSCNSCDFMFVVI